MLRSILRWWKFRKGQKYQWTVGPFNDNTNYIVVLPNEEVWLVNKDGSYNRPKSAGMTKAAVDFAVKTGQYRSV